MDYLNLIRERHSIRAYKSIMVEEEKLNMILEAGVMAPTAANRQAFKIVVIKNPGHEETLRKIYGREWFYTASAVIGICGIPDNAWIRSDGKNYSDVDCAIVMDHMILAATSLGLGTCWIGAFDPKAAREVLKLEDGLEPVAFTPIGYPEDNEFKKIRKRMDEIVTYI